MRTLLLTAIASLPIAVSANCADDFVGSAGKKSDLIAALKCIEQIKGDNSGLPVGTVVASTLSPREFAKQVSDPATFDPRISRWALADGRDVSDSKYRNAAVSVNIPDLRGMFLRGLNVGRNDGLEDPEAKRVVGSTQNDELKSHAHSLGLGMWGLASGKGQGNLETGRPPVSTKATGGDETRPRNVAVYYYIKVN